MNNKLAASLSAATASRNHIASMEINTAANPAASISDALRCGVSGGGATDKGRRVPARTGSNSQVVISYNIKV